MPQSVNLSKIGSRVKIDLEKVKDRISANLIDKISGDPRAVSYTHLTLPTICSV